MREQHAPRPDLRRRTPEDSLRFLSRASEALTTSLSARELADRVCALAIPFLADWCTLHVFGRRGELLQRAGAHVDASKAPLIDELHDRFPLRGRTRGILAQALRTGEAQMLPLIDDAVLADNADDPEAEALLRRLGTASSIAVPLVARGRTLGVMAFVRTSPGRAHEVADLVIAEEFARRIALALDNARLFHEIREAEYRMRALVQGLDAILWEGDPDDLRFSFVSQHAEAVLGYPVSRWTDEPGFWLSIVHHEDRDRLRAAARRAMSQRAGELEYRATTADGRVVWLRQTVQAASSVGPDGDDRAHVRGLIFDVTETKRAERRRAVEYAAATVLASAASLVEAMPKILEGVGDAIGWDVAKLWITDERAGVLRFLEMWHRPDLDAERLREASSASLLRPGEGLPGRVWERREPIWVENVAAEERDGSRTAASLELGLCSALAFPVAIGDQVLAVMSFYARTFTPPDEPLLRTLTVVGSQVAQFIERRRAEIWLRESEERKRGILEAALDAIVTIDEHGSIVDWNPAAERTFGYPASEVVGSDLGELLLADPLREEYEAGLRRFRETGEADIVGGRRELSVRRADGEEIICEIALTRVNLAGSTVFTAHLRDVTERTAAERELAFQRSLLATQSEATLDGILVTDDEGRILYSNTRFKELWRITDESLHNEWELLGSILGQLADPQQFLDRIALVGQQPERELRDEVPLADGRTFDRWTTPLRTEDGIHLGRAWYFRDITEQKVAERSLERRRERAAFLARVSDRLTASLDQTAILEGVADVLVPEFGDLCFVDVVVRGGEVRRAAMAHVRGDEGRSVVPVAASIPIATRPDGGLARVLRSGRTMLLDDLDEDDIAAFAHDASFPALAERLGVRSLLSVPLLARGRTLGAITVASSRPGRYGDDERDMFEGLAQRVALAQDNARLYAERTHVAQTLQQSLLPPHVPEIPGLEVAARYHPAGEGSEVGGDFYDIFQRSPRSWGIVLGDVCGKGAEAAVLTALARYTVRAAAMEAWKPSRILGRLNDAILRNPGEDRFCSIAYAVAEPNGRGMRITLSLGGHPLPIVLRRDGAIERVGRTGMVVGLFDSPELHDATVELGPGDVAVFYTDGVTEGRSLTSAFGEDMLITLLGWYHNLHAVSIAERVERTVVDFQQGTPSDDIAVLVLRVPPT